MRKEAEIALGIGAGLLIFESLTWSFSQFSRYSIKDRARRTQGRLVSELSGRWDMPLECAHFDHNKLNPEYDHPSNGVLMTVDEHLLDHINRAGENGLTKDENDWAIKQLMIRVADIAGIDYVWKVLEKAIP